MSIEIVVFDTRKDARAYLDEAFKANLSTMDTAIAKFHTDLDMNPKYIGKGLELKCIVELYGIGKKYDFMAGVRTLGEYIDVSFGEYKNVNSLSAGVKKVLQRFAPMHTSYSYTFAPSFYTCMEEQNIFSEEEIKNVRETSIEAIKEIGKEKGLTAAVKRVLRKGSFCQGLLEKEVKEE